jgi:hypothetical protein
MVKMGTTVGLGRSVMIYICICILLYMGGVRVIGNDGVPSNPSVDNAINNLVNINGSNIGVSSNIQGSVDKNLQKTSSGLFNFVDSLQSVGNFIAFLFNIIFAPVGLLTSTGMPWQISLMVGVPLMVMLWLGIAYFIRSGA